MIRTRLVVCCLLLGAACSAGENRVDPGDLELRDLLGMSPEAASAWDADQRTAARRVIDEGLHRSDARAVRAPLNKDAITDCRITKTLASIDASRARRGAGSLGVVQLAVGDDDLIATPHAGALDAHAASSIESPGSAGARSVAEGRRGEAIEIQLAGWDTPALQALPARGMDTLAALASDAGHRGGPLVVQASPRLAVVAGYQPAGAEPARLVVNPVLLAALEPAAGAAAATPPAASTPSVRSAPPASSVPSVPSTPTTALGAASPGAQSPLATSPQPSTKATMHPGYLANATGNPYSFYGSVAECAAAQRTRCEACLADASCGSITNLGDGNSECTQFGLQMGRGYFLICINLALAIDAVSSCTAQRAPSCPRDEHASETIGALANNANFLDDRACGDPLDSCLATVFGTPDGTFPGPGSDPITDPPRDTGVTCDDWWNDPNCDSNIECDANDPACDDSGSCGDSNEQSGCDDTGDGGGGGDCGGGGGGDCGGDSSGGGGGDCGGGGGGDCGGGDSGGGDCGGGGGGGDCGGGGGGGDCGGGGGGDCGGGGGDCGGGGGDCNAGGRHHGAGIGVTVAVMWAFLPVPFAIIARRRSERRRARAEADAEAAAQEVVS